MQPNQIKKISKFLSLILRHKPETIGIQLDENGWTSVEELIHKIQASGKKIDLQTLELIVAENDKKRFGFNEDRTLIRANQGHSLEINLGYIPKTPPEILYHGTAVRNLESIFATGLTKRQRHHVHLSTNQDTAKSVGARYGKPVLLEVMALQMYNDGHSFFESTNKVWLTEEVPVKYLRQKDSV